MSTTTKTEANDEALQPTAQNGYRTPPLEAVLAVPLARTATRLLALMPIWLPAILGAIPMMLGWTQWTIYAGAMNGLVVGVHGWIVLGMLGENH